MRKAAAKGMASCRRFSRFGVYDYVGCSRYTCYISSFYQGPQPPLIAQDSLNQIKNPNIMQGKVYSQKSWLTTLKPHTLQLLSVSLLLIQHYFSAISNFTASITITITITLLLALVLSKLRFLYPIFTPAVCCYQGLEGDFSWLWMYHLPAPASWVAV